MAVPPIRQPRPRPRWRLPLGRSVPWPALLLSFHQLVSRPEALVRSATTLTPAPGGMSSSANTTVSGPSTPLGAGVSLDVRRTALLSTPLGNRTMAVALQIGSA